METINSNNFEEEILNLAELEGEDLEVNLEELRQNPGDFEKTFIQAPDEISFEYNRYLE